MKTFTIDDIRSWKPCYDPAKYLPEGWQGTALDILNVDDCPIQDRFWVVLREDCIDARTLRLFAVWCARQTLALIDNPDQRSIEACNVAERYANGDATDDELAAVRAAARAAASDAAWAAAWAAARAEASDAAWAAASDAAWAAAWAAARAAAWAAASDAASDAQLEQLKAMLAAKEMES